MVGKDSLTSGNPVIKGLSTTILTRTRTYLLPASSPFPMRSSSITVPSKLPSFFKSWIFYLLRGRLWFWTQKSVFEKSTSLKLQSDAYSFNIKCSPLKLYGRLSQILLTSTSWLNINKKIFLSTTATSTSLMVFHAFDIISLTTVLEKTLKEITFPNNNNLAWASAYGSTSKLIGAFDHPSFLVFATRLSI